LPDRNAAVSCEFTTDLEAAHYLRFVVRDRPGIVAALGGVLAGCHINLDAVLQKAGHSKSALPFVITLEPCRQKQLDNALAKIAAFDFLAEAPVTMPILK
jgi:homoserine dehydrogenase